MECIGIIISVIRTIVAFTIDLADRCPEIISTLITPLGMIITIIIAFYEYNKFKKQKRKDIITNYLIGAWTKLENASNRIPPDRQQKLDIESSIGAIMLFGSEEQAILATELCEEMKRGVSANTLNLLNKLRDDLRKELNIPAHTVPYRALRFPSEQYYTINRHKKP